MASGETYSYKINKTSLCGVVKLNNGQLRHVSGNAEVTGAYTRNGEDIEVFVKIIHKDLRVQEYHFFGTFKENEAFNLTEKETGSWATVEKISSDNDR
jgi:hypothetical protein